MSDVEVLRGRAESGDPVSRRDGIAGSYVDALVGEAGRHRGGLFLGFAEEDGEHLDGRHGDVSPVITRQEGLALEVEEEDG